MSLTVKYLNGTSFEITCRAHSLITDQPKSEDGTDRGMTPVELFNASLAACAAYYSLMYLRRRVEDLTGFEVTSSWQYLEKPHRVGIIHLTLVLPQTLTVAERRGLLRTVEHCTIENTLNFVPDIQVEIMTKDEELA